MLQRAVFSQSCNKSGCPCCTESALLGTSATIRLPTIPAALVCEEWSFPSRHFQWRHSLLVRSCLHQETALVQWRCFPALWPARLHQHCQYHYCGCSVPSVFLFAIMHLQEILHPADRFFLISHSLLVASYVPVARQI